MSTTAPTPPRSRSSVGTVLLEIRSTSAAASPNLRDLEFWETHLVEVLFNGKLDPFLNIRTKFSKELFQLHENFSRDLPELRTLIEILTQDKPGRLAEVLAQFSPGELRQLVDASGGML